jgi:hypothetical protein
VAILHAWGAVVARREEEVLRLQIPVNDACGVGLLERQRHLMQIRHDLLR